MGVLFPKTIPYEAHKADGIGGHRDEAGDWVPGDTELFTFKGSVQPADGEDFQASAVGREDKGLVKIYSNIVLPMSSDGGDEAGALVYWKGKKWEVIAEGENQNDLINHYKYIGQYAGVVKE